MRSDYVLMHAFNCSFVCKVVFMMALQCLLFNGVASYCMLLHGNAERYITAVSSRNIGREQFNGKTIQHFFADNSQYIMIFWILLQC